MRKALDTPYGQCLPLCSINEVRAGIEGIEMEFDISKCTKEKWVVAHPDSICCGI